jgi:hypothetical protein
MSRLRVRQTQPVRRTGFGPGAKPEESAGVPWLARSAGNRRERASAHSRRKPNQRVAVEVGGEVAEQKGTSVPGRDAAAPPGLPQGSWRGEQTPTDSAPSGAEDTGRRSRHRHRGSATMGPAARELRLARRWPQTRRGHGLAYRTNSQRNAPRRGPRAKDSGASPEGLTAGHDDSQRGLRHAAAAASSRHRVPRTMSTRRWSRKPYFGAVEPADSVSDITQRFGSVRPARPRLRLGARRALAAEVYGGRSTAPPPLTQRSGAADARGARNAAQRVRLEGPDSQRSFGSQRAPARQPGFTTGANDGTRRRPPRAVQCASTIRRVPRRFGGNARAPRAPARGLPRQTAEVTRTVATDRARCVRSAPAW